MSLGGIGVISVFANICPSVSHEMTQAYLTGDIKKSAAIQIQYSKLMDALFWDVSPIPIKAAMNLAGFDCGECRLPLDRMSEQELKKLIAVLEEYNLLK